MKRKAITKKAVTSRVSSPGILTALLLTQLIINPSHAYEVSVVEKEYDARCAFRSLTIRGDHYRPEPDTGKPLLLLVHGSTYGKWMWDVPGYSWVEFFVAQHGYPVLAIDRLGYGGSSRPDGDILTPRCNARSMKQVLWQVRREDRLRQIIWIGHSLGGLVGNMIAGESNLIDGLITMGWVHEQETITGPPISDFLKSDYVAWTDAERTEAFYHLPGAEQDIIDYDNARAQPTPRGTIWSIRDPDLGVLSSIDVPVLLAAGEFDALWIDIDLDAEAALFESAPVTTYLQQDAGHMNILHSTNQSLLDEVITWILAHF